MAYKKITTFTRTGSEEWPFFATELLETPYDTQSTAFMNWVRARSDVDFIFAYADPQPIGESGSVINASCVVTLSFEDEAAYTAWNIDREADLGTDEYLNNAEVSDYLTANNMTIVHTTESD